VPPFAFTMNEISETVIYRFLDISGRPVIRNKTNDLHHLQEISQGLTRIDTHVNLRQPSTKKEISILPLAWFFGTRASAESAAAQRGVPNIRAPLQEAV
jgi:hypothetical protein